MMKALNSPKEKEMRRVWGPFPSQSFQPWSLWLGASPPVTVFQELSEDPPSVNHMPIRLWTPGRAHRGTDSQTKCHILTSYHGNESWATPAGLHREEGYRLSLHNSPSCHCCILTPQHTEQKRAPESSMPGFITKGAPRCQLRCSLELPWPMAWKSFPGGTCSKEPACQCRRHKRHRFNPWVGKIPGGRHGNQLQYPCLGIPHGQKSLAGYSP